MDALKAEALRRLEIQDYAGASTILRRALEQNPREANNWYLLGQCHRFLLEMRPAEDCLLKSLTIEPNAPMVLHALGIVVQQTGRFDEAINIFNTAIHEDGDLDLAYNSLGFTYRLRGSYEDAIRAYQMGLDALFRKILKSLKNLPQNPIVRTSGEPFGLWAKFAMQAAMQFSARSGQIDSVAWPTPETALHEEVTGLERGLFWIDRVKDGETTRFFLPNYLNTIEHVLSADSTYFNLVNNCGIALRELGFRDEADNHFREAARFHSPGW